jgi:hypothetical protein
MDAVDVETGELAGQLMFGICVPSVPILASQRRGIISTTEAHFNGTRWSLEEGDKMSVQVKDGRWIVKIVKAWE